MLREAADLLQRLLASCTLLEGDFRWMCASMVPLGAFVAWCTQGGPCLRAGPTCGRQHMQQLQQHFLELWMRRLSTQGAGRKDYFRAGYAPRRPGGGGGRARPYEIVRAQRPWAVVASRPHPPTTADSKPEPCCRCPVHLQLQCE